MTLDKDAFPLDETSEAEAETVTTADTAPAEAESVTEDEIPFSITVDDGLKRVPINNTAGEKIGEFRFRPTDMDIVTRFNRMVERWTEVTDALDGIEDDEDGTIDLTNPQVISAMETAKTKLFELCDYAFGGNASKAFFGSMNPFSPIDGKLYCENVMTAVGDFISRYFQRETLKINSRLKKYLPKDHLRKGGRRRK